MFETLDPEKLKQLVLTVEMQLPVSHLQRLCATDLVCPTNTSYLHSVRVPVFHEIWIADSSSCLNCRPWYHDWMQARLAVPAGGDVQKVELFTNDEQVSLFVLLKHWPIDSHGWLSTLA